MGSKAQAVSWSKLQVASSNGQRLVILASQIEQDEMCYRADAISRLRSWERHGWGKVIVGRRGAETRFQVSSSLAQALASGTSATIPPKPIAAGSPSGQQSVAGAKVSLVSHLFKLRPNIELRLNLPSDLTDREASRIARFVEAVPL
jgi:hypothetical protein